MKCRMFALSLALGALLCLAPSAAALEPQPEVPAPDTAEPAGQALTEEVTKEVTVTVEVPILPEKPPIQISYTTPDEIVQAVRDGKLRHFFLVGGCDGTRPSRRYYTEFARLTPPDTILLTLACGKFRLNDLPLGTVPGTGLPRILDVGQCNDAYSAIRIALALADAFGCGVNDLPLSLVLCWFEQKAVCILIALLALGIRNIRLGPTLPPFLSPGVVRTLQERYGLKPIATPEADLQAILGR